MKNKDALIGSATSSWGEKIEVSLAAPFFDRIQVTTFRKELTREGPKWMKIHKLCLEHQGAQTVIPLLEKAARVAIIGAEERKDLKTVR